ncbi:MAG TPA: AbrB/MazE/SpoVT family DNA-binding domain-containing protein [Candidatus Paceibacterota bacterium]
MATQFKETKSIARVKQKGQVTIPAALRAAVGIDEGDFVEISREQHRIVLTPKVVSDRDPAIAAMLAEALADARAGNLSPAFNNMKEFNAWLKTPEGKNFGKA